MKIRNQTILYPDNWFFIYKITCKINSKAYIGLALTHYERYDPTIDDENALDDVLIYLNKALQLDPNSSLAYLERGNYYRRIRRRDLAIKDYEKSLEIIPHNSEALYRLILLYKRNHNYKDALLTLERLEKFSKSREDLNRLYSCYYSFYKILDQSNMAEYYLNKIAEAQITPSYIRGLYMHYIDTGQYDKALIYVEKFFVENNVSRNAQLGWIYYRKKDFATAIKYYKKCYDLIEVEGINTHWSDEIFGDYGVSLIALGQIEKGTQMINKQIYNVLCISNIILLSLVCISKSFWSHNHRTFCPQNRVSLYYFYKLISIWPIQITQYY